MDLISQIREAGVVGCGGAGFPTHVKYAGGPVEYLIINGAECEPLLRTDRYIMKHLTARVIEGCEAVMRQLGAAECRIALKKTYTEEIRALRAVISEKQSPVQLKELDSFYPAGDEQTMVYEVTKRVVPPSGIPIDVGCVVSNIATILAVRDAMEGQPLIMKYLTVTGEVKRPSIVHVPVGTSFDACIALTGGAKHERYFVVSGGPMMGRRLTMAEAKEAVVTKTTSGILILPENCAIETHAQITLQHMMNRAKSACIQCSFCTQMCPRHLLGHPIAPHKIMRKLSMSTDCSVLVHDQDVIQAAICCECGICEVYACPMGLAPKRVNQMMKEKLREAGIRYQKPEGPFKIDPNREGRKVPAGRVAARLGVYPWYDLTIDHIAEGSSNLVKIPVSQHIGAPAQPVVSVGDEVKCGQLIAKAAENALSVNIHSSIDGYVKAINEKNIIIRRNGK